MPKQTLKITLPATLEFSSLLRLLSDEVFKLVGFDEAWVHRLQLVVDELFMNANHYGSRKTQGSIYIEFTIGESDVTFRIEDEGGESKIKAEDLRKTIQKNSDEMHDLTKTSGRGLALISNLWTDELVIEDSKYGGIAISFSKKVTADPPLEPPALPL